MPTYLHLNYVPDHCFRRFQAFSQEVANNFVHPLSQHRKPLQLIYQAVMTYLKREQCKQIINMMADKQKTDLVSPTFISSSYINLAHWRLGSNRRAICLLIRTSKGTYIQWTVLQWLDWRFIGKKQINILRSSANEKRMIIYSSIKSFVLG